jgi:hypothetical protein
MPDQQQFREHYAGLPDDQLQLAALRDDLLPEAREAMTRELKARGLTDLEGFQKDVASLRSSRSSAEAGRNEPGGAGNTTSRG